MAILSCIPAVFAAAYGGGLLATHIRIGWDPVETVVDVARIDRRLLTLTHGLVDHPYCYRSEPPGSGWLSVRLPTEIAYSVAGPGGSRLSGVTVAGEEPSLRLRGTVCGPDSHLSLTCARSDQSVCEVPQSTSILGFKSII